MKKIIATPEGIKGVSGPKIKQKAEQQPKTEVDTHATNIRARVEQIMEIDQQPMQQKQEPKKSKDEGIPAMIIDSALKKFSIHSEGELREMVQSRAQSNRQGEHDLEAFAQGIKRPYNLLYIDSNLSRKQLESRLKMLSDLYFEYTSLDMRERNQMEQVLCEMFGMPAMTVDVQSYLDTLESDDLTAKSQGAENTNLIFMDSNMEPKVIKRSKGRHSIDFTSILKLMYNMHAMALHFNEEPSTAENVKINASYRDMMIYKNKEGKYERMVRQEFAEGILIKELDPEIRKDPEYRKAWRSFLNHVTAMSGMYGSIVDISDSTKGNKTRGNVANSGNIFVKLPSISDPNYTFTIIDPDVFDTEPGESKFDPMEHMRKKGTSGILSAVKTAMTNFARDTKKFGMGVRNWQEQYTKRELER